MSFIEIIASEVAAGCLILAIVDHIMIRNYINHLEISIFDLIKHLSEIQNKMRIKNEDI